jgi:serine/threonine-protein kinase RsbW
MAEERRVVIPGVLEELTAVCEFVTDAAEAVGLDDRGVYHCQMAVDEWCTNIIQHGFEGRDETAQIEISLRLEPAQLSVMICDNCAPFDPTTLPDPDPMKPLEERQPGGLGWFFIRKIMSEVHYEFKDGRNYLTMIKKGAPQESEKASGEPKSPFPARTSPEGIRVIMPSGRVDSSVGRQLEAALLTQIEAGYKHLVVDMGAITYISSTGLKALLTGLRRAQEVHGKITLATMTVRVREIFEMSGFDTLFTITSTVEESVQAILKAEA